MAGEEEDRNIGAARRLQNQDGKKAKQRREPDRRTPLAGRNPHLIGGEQQDNDGEACGIEDVLAIEAEKGEKWGTTPYTRSKSHNAFDKQLGVARNGNYKHGRYTAETIATRRWVKEKIREARALAAVEKTIGIVVVAAFAASADCVPAAAITATWLST
jgi:hypothetical protein